MSTNKPSTLEKTATNEVKANTWKIIRKSKPRRVTHHARLIEAHHQLLKSKAKASKMTLSKFLEAIINQYLEGNA